MRLNHRSAWNRVESVGFTALFGKALAAALLFLSAVPSTTAQTALEPPASSTCPDVKAGVIVERVTKNFEAEKAGVKEGDFIVAWTRSNLHGDIRSPFDLADVETEQGPRGGVTLQGIQGGAPHTWNMGPGAWNLRTRPNLPEDLLTTYEHDEKLTKTSKFSEAEQQWQTLAENTTSRCPWLSVWFLSYGARALADVRQWSMADNLYQRATDRAAGTAPETRAALLRTWVLTYEQRNEWPPAERHETEALEEARKISGANFAVFRSLHELGRLANFRGDLALAEQYFRQALQVAQSLAPNSLEVARALNTLGNLSQSHADLVKAEQYYREALTIQQKLAPEGSEVASSLNNLGIVAYDRRDLVKAEEYYRQSLQMHNRLNPRSTEATDVLNNLGNIAYLRQDLSTAEDYYTQSLKIREEIAPGSLRVAASMDNLGNVEYLRGDLSKSEEYHRKALAIIEKLAPGSLDVARSLNNLGAVAAELGDLAKTEEYNRQAFAIRQKLEPGSLDVAISLGNLGLVAEDRGDLTRAEEYFKQALEIKQKLAPDSMDLAEALLNIGDVLSNSGDLRKGEEFYRRALALTDKLAPDSANAGKILGNLAVAEQARGDLDDAERDLDKALEIERKVTPDSLEMADTLSCYVTVKIKRGDQARAEEYARQRLAIRKRVSPDSVGYADALASLAEILQEEQQADEAAQLYAEALDVLDRQLIHLGGSTEVRAGFRGSHADYYEEYADLLVQQKKPEIAFAVLERSRARTLLEMLATSHVDIREGADTGLIETERRLQAVLAAKRNRRASLLEDEHTPEQLAAINKEIDKTLTDYQDLEGRIRSNSPRYAGLTQPKPLTAQQAQQLLDTDTVLLDYSLGEKRSLLFILTANGLQAYELPQRDEIEKAARRAYDLLTARRGAPAGETSSMRKTRLAKADQGYQAAAATLSQILLGPVAPQLGAKRLLIVADGALEYVPFSALPVPAGAQSAAGTPLVAEHEVVNLPSASVLAFFREHASGGRVRAPKEVAILADPVFDKDDQRVGKTPTTETNKQAAAGDVSPSAAHLTRSIQDLRSADGGTGESLPRLAFSRREAAAIMAVAKSGKAMEALDFRASRETALSRELRDYRILHFATHGLLDNEHPELSGLVFSLVDSHGKPQDGFVDLQDIYNLTLSAELVVLSACETGLGKEIRGEGLVGLTRGFMYAGSPRVVASLWSVDDVATSELMSEFYRAMLQSGLRPAAALRSAQLALQKRERWASPYYWAAFTLQGEWN